MLYYTLITKSTKGRTRNNIGKTKLFPRLFLHFRLLSSFRSFASLTFKLCEVSDAGKLLDSATQMPICSDGACVSPKPIKRLPSRSRKQDHQHLLSFSYRSQVCGYCFCSFRGLGKGQLTFLPIYPNRVTATKSIF